MPRFGDGTAFRRDNCAAHRGNHAKIFGWAKSVVQGLRSTNGHDLYAPTLAGRETNKSLCDVCKSSVKSERQFRTFVC